MGDNKLSDEMLAGGGGEKRGEGRERWNITSYRKKSNTRLVC